MLYPISDLYLEHYGIAGQKWGVRRFQNKNGTLTTEGKKRYRNSSKPTSFKGMSNLDGDDNYDDDEDYGNSHANKKDINQISESRSKKDIKKKKETIKKILDNVDDDMLDKIIRSLSYMVI